MADSSNSNFGKMTRSMPKEKSLDYLEDQSTRSELKRINKLKIDLEIQAEKKALKSEIDYLD